MAESTHLMGTCFTLTTPLRSAHCYLFPNSFSLFIPKFPRTNPPSLSLSSNQENVRESCKGVFKAMAGSFGSRLEESVKKTVSEHPVVIYSKTWCSYSMEVKGLFKRIGVEPLVIELDELGPQGPQLQKVLERITGQYTVPNVFIDTVKLYRKGELKSLLEEAGIKNTQSIQP